MTATPVGDTTSSLGDRVAGLMPGLIEELATLVAVPSVAFPGFPAEPVHRMSEAVVALLRRSGAENARLLDIPGGYPAVWAEIPAPAGAPTVLLYAHYDVQPAPPEQGWDTEPFTATTKPDGRIYGRGAADDKSGLIIHAGVLQALGDDIPVGIKILIEGEEETISHLEDFVDANPEMFDCDAFVIADMGNQAVGRPALTTALRGEVSCTVRVRTLAFPVHSGVFGGAATASAIRGYYNCPSCTILVHRMPLRRDREAVIDHRQSPELGSDSARAGGGIGTAVHACTRRDPHAQPLPNLRGLAGRPRSQLGFPGKMAAGLFRLHALRRPLPDGPHCAGQRA